MSNDLIKSNNIEVIRSTNIEAIKIVVFKLWEDISEDGADKDLFEPDLKDVWLELKADDKTIGFYQLHQWNGSTLELHANILPQYRVKYTLEVSNAVRSWILENIPRDQFKKLVAFIPEIHTNVLHYAIRSGWKHEGTISQGYVKDTICMDLDIVGITIEELRDLGEIEWEQQQQ